MKRFWYFMSPTGFESVMYVVLSIVLLLLGSYKAILSEIATTQTDSRGNSVRFNPSDFSNAMQSNNWTAVVSTVFFWAMVGTVLALVGWAFINTMIDLYNTYVVSTGFMHPRQFQQRSWWGDYLARLIIRMLTGVGLVIYTLIFTQVLYPLWSDIFKMIIDRPGQGVGWMAALMAVLGLAVSLHGIVVLFRLLAMKARLLENR
jgi:hypothetical protein